MRQFINLVESAQANDLSFIDRAIAAVDEAGVPESVVVSLEDGDDGEVEIKYLEVPEDLRGQGWGAKVLAVITHLADHYLEEFYWWHGFEGGRHMTRKPRHETQ